MLKNRGSAVMDVLVGAAALIFVILPVFSLVAEKFILVDKAQMIRDAVDITNIAVYDSLITSSLGKENVDLSRDEALAIFRTLLASNLSLNADLSPQPQSLAEDRVTVESLEIYASGFPVNCPDGKVMTRPSVHSSVSIPIRPSLYREAILELMGREYVDVRVHVDSEIPINN